MIGVCAVAFITNVSPLSLRPLRQRFPRKFGDSRTPTPGRGTPPLPSQSNLRPRSIRPTRPFCLNLGRRRRKTSSHIFILQRNNEKSHIHTKKQRKLCGGKDAHAHSRRHEQVVLDRFEVCQSPKKGGQSVAENWLRSVSPKGWWLVIR